MFSEVVLFFYMFSHKIHSEQFLQSITMQPKLFSFLFLPSIFFSVEFLSSYLINEGVNEDNLNKELIKVVDERYGKPYEENITKECNSFIYKLIPNSKDEIDKLVKSGIY